MLVLLPVGIVYLGPPMIYMKSGDEKFLILNAGRCKYINRIIKKADDYNYATDIFIHTNKHDLSPGDFNDYTNGSLNIISHDLNGIHPYYLTWKCRDLLRQQKDDYDVFMYVEDDILIPEDAIEYWLRYNKKLIAANYNLGFLRIEIQDGEEYLTDLQSKLNTIIYLDGDPYVINNINPYCAFWIYSKEEFHRFLNHPYYDIDNIEGYHVREKSAIGLHGEHSSFYKGTLIPIIHGRLDKNCRVYHMTNNYVVDDSNLFSTIKFKDGVAR